MPELPEVQTVVNDLIDNQIVGEKIVKALLYYPKSVDSLDPDTFAHEIKGKTIQHIERKGKYIVMKVAPFYLLIHLRMSGRIFIQNGQPPFNPHERVRLLLGDGRILSFIDQRKFGRINLLKNPEDKLKDLGLDPLDGVFSFTAFSALMDRKIKIKSLLLNQNIIAGIGNIYADEILWQANIHPETLAGNLTQKENHALYESIQDVLFQAIKNQGTSLGEHPSNFHSASGKRGQNGPLLKVYHQTGQPCHRCQTPIQRIKLTGRSTHFCPSCQQNSSL